jgi:hypothetical protein
MVLMACLNGGHPILSKHCMKEHSANFRQNSDLIPIRGGAEGSTNKTPSVHDVISSVKQGRLYEIGDLVVDHQSGQHAILSSDRKTLTLIDKGGSTLWSANVIECLASKFGTIAANGNPDPLVTLFQDNKIGSMQVINGYLTITVGKMVVCIDKKTGEIIPLGAD